MDFSKLRVAVVHEWLIDYSGSERVVEQFLKLFPQADLFSVVDFLEGDERKFLGGKPSRTTFIQNLPGARKKFRNYLPLMPMAIEQHDLSGYDLIISSSHAVAKGVLTGPDQIHISYVHSPIRYAWDMQHQYLAESGLTKGFKAAMARAILHYMRIWDSRTAAGVDVFVANSAFIGRRIKKAYRRESTVVYPPVDTASFTINEVKEDFYLTASRMVPYKKVPLLIEAFAGMPDKKLIVIGDGPEWQKANAAAASNVQLMGYQSFAVLKSHMQRAKAFVFAAEEDFGITPVEAQACGTPVIAYGRGGALETVIGLGKPGATGVFFHEQSVAAIQGAVRQFEQHHAEMTPDQCRSNAERFSVAQFQLRMSAVIESSLNAT
jgi:glycosyltransferase involved in cell wall biosynthesis